jgi:hypothetical protein
MGRPRKGVTSSYLPTMHFLLRRHRSQGLLKDLSAVVRMHCGVAIAMKNNSWDEWRIR